MKCYTAVHRDGPRALSSAHRAKKTHTEPCFEAHEDTFLHLLAADAQITLLHERDWAFCHEAGVYHAPSHSVFFTANWQARKHDGPTSVFSVHCTDYTLTDWTSSLPAEIVNANGACAYGEDEILFCCQGDDVGGRAGLVAWSPSTGLARVLVDHFHGRDFNSPNDVVVDPRSGHVYFTDPPYGRDQNFRPADLQLPVQIYGLDPATGRCYAMDDSLLYPNGLCLSHDGTTLYATDTHAVRGHERARPTSAAAVSDPRSRFEVRYDPAGKAHIYAFQLERTSHGSTVSATLRNRRMVAHVDCGIPDGCKVDRAGNVWTGCGDGVHVHHAETRVLLGKIVIPGGVANFCFADGKVWLFNETRLYVATGLEAACPKVAIATTAAPATGTA